MIRFRLLGREDGAPRIRLAPLLEQEERWLFLSTSIHQQQRQLLQARCQFSPKSKSASTLILGLLTPRTVRNKFLLLKRPVYGILLLCPSQLRHVENKNSIILVFMKLPERKHIIFISLLKWYHNVQFQHQTSK